MAQTIPFFFGFTFSDWSNLEEWTNFNDVP